MAKSKDEIKQQTAAEIAKDVYEILEKHTTTKNVYADNSKLAQFKSVPDATPLFDDLEAMFTQKYNIYPFKTLNAMSWQEIKDAVNEGIADKIFKIGDTKTIELYTGETIEVVIVGFNHDKISGSDDFAGITFGLKNMLDGEFEINEDYTNVGGWKKSKMRNVYMQRFFKLLPADLQEVIETVDKITGVGGGSEQTEITQDKLFLFSKREVTGSNEYVAPMEGKQYPYFENEDNRIKERAGSAYYWWLRSPLASIATSFCCIDSNGDFNIYGAGGTGGVSFGFCI